MAHRRTRRVARLPFPSGGKGPILNVVGQPTGWQHTTPPSTPMVWPPDIDDPWDFTDRVHELERADEEPA